MPATITKCGTQTCAANGRDGSLADICDATDNVHFTAGHQAVRLRSLRSANSGLLLFINQLRGQRGA
jgi:hypothetical protein